ncbi:hypothetical protein GC249_07195, partial [Lactobacillus plantarum]|nr:hypothetical protein [Lactiplantibacillus plantarum]
SLFLYNSEIFYAFTQDILRSHRILSTHNISKLIISFDSLSSPSIKKSEFLLRRNNPVIHHCNIAKWDSILNGFDNNIALNWIHINESVSIYIYTLHFIL